MAAEEMFLVEQYKELACELENKIEVLNATLEQKDLQLEKVKEELQEKVNRIIDLEFELLTFNEGISNLDSSNEKEDIGTEKLLEERERQIERLESELRKRTCDLQAIVNKELWEKNRSIEKLQTVIKSKNQELGKLEKSVYGKDLQLKILKEKINELGVHVNLPPGLVAIQTCSQVSSFENAHSMEEQLKFCLEERKHFMKEIEELQIRLRNTPEHDENRQLLRSQDECKNLREELEKSEKLKQEAQEVSSVLNGRLEELCIFLNSLLKQKSVLGFLGSEQTEKVQHIVNRSLDLSRTLSTNMIVNADQSLLQLSNITNLLNATRNDSMNLSHIFSHEEEFNAILSVIPSDITLTYQNHLSPLNYSNNEQAEVIRVLRVQVANLKHEIELRDVELAKKLANDFATEEKSLKNDQDLMDALNNAQSKEFVPLLAPELIFQNPAIDGRKLNTTSSTLVAEKSATSTTLKNHHAGNQSESESWSEPDRTVSLARIGLLDESLKRTSLAGSSSKRNRSGETSDMSTDSTENGHNLSRTPSKRTTLAESRQTIIALHEQVCDLEVKLKDKENQLLAAQVAYYETDNLLKNEQIKLEEIRKQLNEQTESSNNKLEEIKKQKIVAENRAEEANQKLIQVTSEIKEANRKLKEAEDRKEQAEMKIYELQKVVSTLEEFKQNMENTMCKKDKEMQNTINELEIEKTKAISAVEAAEHLLQKTKEDLKVAEMELKNMRKCEEKLREELEKNYQENLKKAEEQYVISVKMIESNYEAQTNKCREAVLQIQSSYEKDYIKRSEVEQRTLRVDEITKEVENLKFVIQDCDAKIQSMEEKELELTNKIQTLQQTHAEKIFELQRELDNATLQYSEEVLEKTKLKNENGNLKDHIHKFNDKETELIKEIQELHDDFQDKTIALQTTVAKLEQQKFALDSKINSLEVVNAELQSANAEMHNRLVKLQINKNSGEPATSLPNYPTNTFDLCGNRSLPINIQHMGHYSRQLSDHSGYTSEDIPLEDVGARNVSNYVQAAIQNIFGPLEEDQERVQANASPDLGIESDHGRFSSLEANVNIPRPLLPTLELTQSMSNLLDPVQDITCANDECCKKVKQITNENVDLRKRLLRTRRALEETLSRLTLANKQKKEVEKSICRQIHKTSQVLRRAKANLDSGSENDILKK